MKCRVTAGIGRRKEVAELVPHGGDPLRNRRVNHRLFLGHDIDPLPVHRLAFIAIQFLDALREKTMGNLAPEEDTLVIDILGNLKLAFMEMTKAATAAAMQEKVKSRP